MVWINEALSQCHMLLFDELNDFTRRTHNIIIDVYLQAAVYDMLFNFLNAICVFIMGNNADNN